MTPTPDGGPLGLCFTLNSAYTSEHCVTNRGLVAGPDLIGNHRAVPVGSGCGCYPCATGTPRSGLFEASRAIMANRDVDPQGQQIS